MFLCEDVLAAAGVTDFDRYAYLPGAEPEVDMFVDHVLTPAPTGSAAPLWIAERHRNGAVPRRFRSRCFGG